jgi:transcriptional regulator with XRE-family HTH domain
MGGFVLFELSTPNEISAELGSRLRAQRLRLNIQRSELAARAGVSEKTIQNLETKGNVSFESFLKVTVALGLVGSLSSLFEYEPLSIKAMEDASKKRQRASKSKL